MSVGTRPGRGAGLSRRLLRAIDDYHSHHWRGPTAPELAADLGFTPEVGHDHLSARLQQDLSRGPLSCYDSRYGLTRARRSLAEAEA
jgi:hypothetical protein